VIAVRANQQLLLSVHPADAAGWLRSFAAFLFAIAPRQNCGR
jgi:hypothetical protein